MFIKRNSILLLICLLLPQTSIAQEGYNYIHDCVTAFSTLHKMTIAYESALKSPTSIKKAEAAITKFNNDILVPLNLFVKGTKSSNPFIKDVSKDLHDLLTDVLTNNYDMLMVLNKRKKDKKDFKKDFKKDCTAILQKNLFASTFFSEISKGVCVSVMLKSKVKDKQYINMTMEERDLLNNYLTDNYGETIIKGLEIESKTSYERASRVIYEFLNLEWVFLNKTN